MNAITDLAILLSGTLVGTGLGFLLGLSIRMRQTEQERAAVNTVEALAHHFRLALERERRYGHFARVSISGEAVLDWIAKLEAAQRALARVGR